jgi:hypothetical protein
VDGAKTPVPFVSLTEWLKSAHLYEAFPLPGPPQQTTGSQIL